MSGRKYLFVPGNNSLSHVVKCLAISDVLAERGHEARVAVSRKYSAFLRDRGVDHFVLPDIQDTDASGFPSVEWFRNTEQIADCIRAETELLKSYRPDRTLGVFRFTLKASARIAGVPFDSLVCGCMVPGTEEILGFAKGEEGEGIQRTILDGFYRYAGSKVGEALVRLGLPKSNGDVRRMLEGERTFLWDFPEFSPLPSGAGPLHVGPLAWDQWPFDTVDRELLTHAGPPLAVASFGTCTSCLPVAKRLIGILVDMGYRVVLAAGGQKEFLDIIPDDPRVSVYTFAPLPAILPYASLLVTHGGQMTVFEALQNGVPVAVMPFQPEQAHNGVCLERLGCGVRLIPARPFQGNSDVYIRALDDMTDAEISRRITALVRDPGLEERLANVREIIGRYTGAPMIADRLEER